MSMPTINPLATDVRFAEHALIVALADGRAVSVPLAWFPSLLNASAKQRANWRLLGNGVGVHWPELDEDIRVANLLRV